MSEQDTKNVPSPRRVTRGRKVFKGTLRALRIALLFVIFLGVVTAFFLNKIGLPEFAKQKIVEALRAEGWEAEFSRVRLRWSRGIVADDVHLRRTNTTEGPHLFVRQAECGLNFRALKTFAIDVRSFKMRGGRIIWLLHRNGAAEPPFTLNDATGELYFNPNDSWELRSLTGELLGARVHFSGTLANGSLVREWRVAEKKPRQPRRDPLGVWEEVVRTVAQLRFDAPPELSGSFRGDAADFRTFEGHLKFRVPSVASPWGRGTNVLFTTRLFPQLSNAVVQADVALTAGDVMTPWLHADDLRANVEFEPRYTKGWPTNANIALELKGVRSRWATGDYALMTARLMPCPTNAAIAQSDVKAMVREFRSPQVNAGMLNTKFLATHPYTNWQPSEVTGSAELEEAVSPAGKAAEAGIEFTVSIPEKAQWFLAETNLSWPERVRTLPLQSRVRMTQLSLTNLDAAALGAEIDWRWPTLDVRADGALYGGKFSAGSTVDVETRDTVFNGESTVDVHRLAPLLPTRAQKFLRNYSWRSPPTLRASGRVALPPWTNALPQFGDETLPTLSLGGFFDVGPGAYKGVTFNAAQSPFTFTNNVFRIENLALRRPEGNLFGAYTSKPDAKEFHWKYRSNIDPQAVKTLFDAQARRVFDFFEFTSPPSIEGEVWGHWRDPERVGANARVQASDFKFRGESMERCAAALSYTNAFFAVLNPEVRRAGGEKGSAPGIGVDVKRQRLWITNAFGNLNPQVVARCISRSTGKIMADYIFDVAPTTRVNGSVDLRKGSDEDDVHFEVAGGSFHWKDFKFQQLAGNIDWVGRTMALTNMQGIFHGGRAAGHAHFTFPRKRGSDFSFKLSVAEVDFHSFMSDLIGRTNKLEGMLNGELTVVAGNTDEPNSWMGYGSVHLRDGLIWDIPVFGLFSPILNAVAPGLGNSRAKQGSAEFLITNSVISTKDLEMQATAMRMHFEGTVDFEKRIESRVEAELLRDLPGIGLVLSKILWPVTKIFEYRVTGTLGDPKAEPLYIIPKVLLFPLQPFKVLKDLMTDDDPKPSRSPE